MGLLHPDDSARTAGFHRPVPPCRRAVGGFLPRGTPFSSMSSKGPAHEDVLGSMPPPFSAGTRATPMSMPCASTRFGMRKVFSEDSARCKTHESRPNPDPPPARQTPARHLGAPCWTNPGFWTSTRPSKPYSATKREPSSATTPINPDAPSMPTTVHRIC
jgi:hypothetical protein